MMLELVWPLKSGGGSEGQKEEEDLLEVQRSAPRKGVGSRCDTPSGSIYTLLPKSRLPAQRCQTEIRKQLGGNRKQQPYYFYQAKGKHGRLTPQEVCPSSLRKREKFYSLLKVLYFFFLSFFFVCANFQNGHSWHQATQQ